MTIGILAYMITTNRRNKFARRIVVASILTIISISLIVGGMVYYLHIHQPKQTTVTVSVPTQSTKPAAAVVVVPQYPTIHVSAMGDMLAHDTIDANAKTATGYNFAQYFTDIRPAYKSSDLVFCNQEGLSSGEPFGISGYPAFNAPTQFSGDLQSGAGCNVINLANNHMGDKGVSATNATLDNWAGLKPLAISGANKNAVDQSNDVSYATIKGIKLGFVSFSDFNNNKATPAYSVNIYHDLALFHKLVTEARQNADFVMVSMHWGTEDSSVVNADQKAQVDLLASWGVDVVVGTGPHVLQEVDSVVRPDGGKMIVWNSIGNMLSSQLNIPELFSGIAGFDVIKIADKKVDIKNLSFIPTYMHYEWTAAEKANNSLLARKNAHIYLLKDAAAPLARSQLATTVSAQQEYIASTLGSLVTVNNN